MFNPTIQNVFRMKCPKCHTGDFFLGKSYNFKTVGRTHNRCPHCNEDFLREPGYYYGAMYVSYAIGVALFSIIYASYSLWFSDYSVWYPIGLIGFVSVVFGPYLYHLSKIVWISFFVKFDPNKV